MRLALLAFFFWVLEFSASAKDWPKFRGPYADGRWDETGIIEKFPTNGLQIKWRHPVGGGFSSPVVADGRVFVWDVELAKPTSRERLHCFDEKSGKVLWVFKSEEQYGEWAFDPERGAGPTATPIVEGNRIYAVGASGHTHCLNAKTGKVLWQKDISREYQVAEMSCRPSPIIEGKMLILFTGAKPGACVMAVDKETGKEIWKALDDLVSSSTPLAITFGAKRQLIAWSNNAITSLNMEDGHVLWREMMTTSGNDSVATPVFQGNRLLVSGLMMDLVAESAGVNFLWPTNRVPARRILSNTSNPWWVGDYIYSARSSGELVCLEAATGKEIWSTNTITTLRPLGPSINITPQGEGCFLFTDEGNLIRAQLSPSGFREISRFHLIDPTWPFVGTKFVYGPPAFANGHVFARSEREIVCVSLKKKK